MLQLFEAAVELDRRLQEASLSFCFIGGIAIQRWGMPRSTQDLDLTVLAPFGEESDVIDALLAVLDPRIADARTFAFRHRVLLGRRNQVPVDVALGAMPFEQAAVERATLFAIAPGASFRTCGPSDLIVHKVFAGRDQDWIDIRGIMVRSGALLDWNLITAELEMLLPLKDDATSLPRLLELRRKLE